MVVAVSTMSVYAGFLDKKKLRKQLLYWKYRPNGITVTFKESRKWLVGTLFFITIEGRDDMLNAFKRILKRRAGDDMKVLT